MLPYLAASGHNLYTKDVWLYLQRMQELKQEDPVGYKMFAEGYATIRRTDKQYGGIPSDQIIEQLLMRALKTRGGLTRGRGLTEVQQAVWLLSRNVCAEVTNAVHDDLLGLKGGSSEQHVRIGKTSDRRNEEDYENTLTFFRLRNPFDTSHNELENIVTGKQASSAVNIYDAKDIGKGILKKMEGLPVKEFTFKRKEQAITMGSKIQRKDGSVIQINPQNLFDRLIALALVSSHEKETDLDEMLSYELTPFPPSLFEGEELMREAHKPQITELLKKHYSPKPSDKMQKFEGTVVLDGGSLLYTINWTKGTKFQEVAGLYTKFVTKNYLKPDCDVKVVFDSYPEEPTPKDSTHLRRTRQSCTKISVADKMVLDM